MANIRVSALELAVDRKVLDEYSKYLQQADSESRNAAKLEQIFTKLYGAKRVGGSQPLVPDYTVPPGTLISGLAPIFRKSSTGSLNIETKFSRRSSESETSTTIGGRRVGSIARQINTSLGTKLKGEDLYLYMKRSIEEGGLGISGGANLFNFMKDNAPRFHGEAYNKAKNLTIFSKSDTSILAYQIYFPRSSFTSDKFGVSYEADNEKRTFAFSYYLTNSFERNLKEAVQDNITKIALESVKDLKYEYLKKEKQVRFGRKSSEKIDIYWAHSNSIPVANIKTTIPKTKPIASTMPSIIDITKLVRTRTKLRMRRGVGNPKPPKIYERSGTFRNSIEAVANMQTDTINYFYLPYYSSLEKYGYEINTLVEGSIRAVAQKEFGREFILRRNAQSIT